MSFLKCSATGVLLSAMAGCVFMPNNEFFAPPPEVPDSAWLRIVDNTEQSSLYQLHGGERKGGLIRASEWVLQNTQNRGMPKAVGEDYDIDYYETPLVPGVETEVVNSYVEGKHSCLIVASFTPQKQRHYQFQLEADTLRFRCRVKASEIVKGSGGDWQLKPLEAVSYSVKSEDGWQDMHTYR